MINLNYLIVSYFVLYIEGYFEFIIKKYETLATNPSVQSFVNI